MTRKVSQTDLVFGVLSLSGFIRSAQSRVQVSVYYMQTAEVTICATLVNTQTYIQTAFLTSLIRIVQPAELKKAAKPKIHTHAHTRLAAGQDAMKLKVRSG